MSWNVVAAYRRLLSRETGAVVKDWGGKTAVALAFPNTYYTGMSNLGFQALYGLFNDRPDVVCERVFLPDGPLAAEYRRTGAPLLSVESQRPVSEFEMVAFSFSHENDYPNLVGLLNLAGIPARREDRGEQDPVILAGGVCMRTNPEPVADFLDLVLIGDGETQIPRFLEAWRETRSNPLPKSERVSHLARTVPGAYAPAWYKAAFDREGRLVSFEPTRADLPPVIEVARAASLPDPALTTRVLTPDTEFANTRLVEIGRGCPHGCRFCLAGFVYRPPRNASLSSVMNALGPPATENERVGLISPAVADHPELVRLITTLTGQGRQVTVSSLRVEALGPDLLEALVLGRLKSTAIAPEAGNQRMRDIINKGLTEEQILQGAALLGAAGLKRLKLYFMLGLPLETDEDVLAIPDLALKVKERMADALPKRTLRPEITLSMSSFVPKPFTPFERAPMAEVKELKARAKIVRDRIRREPGMRIHFDPPKWAWLQTLLSRGDRRAAELVEALSREGGSLTRALRHITFDPERFVTRPMDDDALTPWSFIRHGLFPDFLPREMTRAQEGRSTPACRPDTCRLCGICRDDEVKEC